MKWKNISIAFLIGIFPFLAQEIKVNAQSSSNNYRIEESYIGPGGGNSNSGSYEMRGSLGFTGGFGESDTYGLWAGYNTDGTEYLELVVSGANIDLGIQSVGSTSYATATFYVRSYPAINYVVTTESDAPTYNGNSFDTMNNQQSAPGTEQFGINLVANTTAAGAPANYGSNPVQYPDPPGTFAHGQAATDYNTNAYYTYNKGDIIAQSNPSEYSWGRTDYTISYVMNISNTTPAGLYSMNHVLVATSTY